MRITLLSFITTLLIFTACKKSQENNLVSASETTDSTGVSIKDIEALIYKDYSLDQNAEIHLLNWAEYNQLEDIVMAIKMGDLSFFDSNEKEIKTLLKELRANIPEAISTPSINARLLVVETKFYKLESLSNLSTTSKDELLLTIQEFLVAFSNLNLQMNKKIEFDSRIIEKP